MEKHCIGAELLVVSACLTMESIRIASPARDVKPLRTLTQINSNKANSCQLLSREPAVARVLVTDAYGAMRTFDVYRTSTPTGFGVTLRSMFAERWMLA